MPFCQGLRKRRCSPAPTSTSAAPAQPAASTALRATSVLDFNLFLGVGAGYNNLAGAGTANIFAGYQAGLSNTIRGYNTLYGVQAGFSNVDGHDNSFYGAGAGYSNTAGVANTFSGSFAGFSNTGSYNTFSGYVAGQFNTTGSKNTFTGYSSGLSNTDGWYNTFSGSWAGHSNTIGSSNAFFGMNAGYSTPPVLAIPSLVPLLATTTPSVAPTFTLPMMALSRATSPAQSVSETRSIRPLSTSRVSTVRISAAAAPSTSTPTGNSAP